jgi:bifunctional DNA-binding transcriptional regulator/antitoxin component of YhaV-PrlF toxin-antitoxin module
MERIKIYKIRRCGTRGFVLTIPQIWADDQKIKPGSEIILYRDGDRLILEKAGKK